MCAESSLAQQVAEHSLKFQKLSKELRECASQIKDVKGSLHAHWGTWKADLCEHCGLMVDHILCVKGAKAHPLLTLHLPLLNFYVPQRPTVLPKRQVGVHTRGRKIEEIDANPLIGSTGSNSTGDYPPRLNLVESTMFSPIGHAHARLMSLGYTLSRCSSRLCQLQLASFRSLQCPICEPARDSWTKSNMLNSHYCFPANAPLPPPAAQHLCCVRLRIQLLNDPNRLRCFSPCCFHQNIWVWSHVDDNCTYNTFVEHGDPICEVCTGPTYRVYEAFVVSHASHINVFFSFPSFFLRLLLRTSMVLRSCSPHRGHRSEYYVLD